MDFGAVFGLSFAVALTGAMSPGPLLTFTLFKSVEAGRRSYLTGLRICGGHAVLEFGLIIAIFSGAGAVLSAPIAVVAIGLIGGGLLVYFGAVLARDLIRGSYMPSDTDGYGSNPGKDITDRTADSASVGKERARLYDMNPFLGGIVISISNPYWILWWITWGLNAMKLFGVSLGAPGAFWGFYLGHEMGDIVWYLPIAVGAGLSGHFLPEKVYRAILWACAVFMMVFGIYLAISVPFSI